MRASHLFGTLEAPGQKAYPSKDIDYWKLNPKQPVQIETMKIQKKLSNGLVWTHPGKDMPLTTTDTFPRLNPEGTWRHLSQGTGSFGAEFKASNPETITSFGILPSYPEEEAMRAALMSRPKVMAEKVAAREEYPKAPAPEFQVGAGRIGTKFTPEKIQRLVDMGIPEELIGKTIEAELQKDLMTYLNNPALLAEVQTTEAIQNAYEKFVAGKMGKTGENASGGAPGSGAQNIGVRAYSFPAQISMLSPKAQRLAELRASEFGPTSLLGEVPDQPAIREVSTRRFSNSLEMGAGPGGGGLSISPFGMLVGTRVAAQAKAEAQEAAEEEAYEVGHSRREMAEGSAAAAAMSAAEERRGRGRPRGPMAPEAAAAAQAKREQTMAQRLLLQFKPGGGM